MDLTLLGFGTPIALFIASHSWISTYAMLAPRSDRTKHPRMMRSSARGVASLRKHFQEASDWPFANKPPTTVACLHSPPSYLFVPLSVIVLAKFPYSAYLWFCIVIRLWVPCTLHKLTYQNLVAASSVDSGHIRRTLPYPVESHEMAATKRSVLRVVGQSATSAPRSYT